MRIVPTEEPQMTLFRRQIIIPSSLVIPDTQAIRTLKDTARRWGLPEWWIGPDRSQFSDWFHWDGCTAWKDGTVLQHLPCWWHDLRCWVGGDSHIKALADALLREERRAVAWDGLPMWALLRLTRRFAWLGPWAKFWHEGFDRLRMTPGELHALQDEETELASALHGCTRGGLSERQCLDFTRMALSKRKSIQEARA
jgi:hypothetical protein